MSPPKFNGLALYQDTLDGVLVSIRDRCCSRPFAERSKRYDLCTLFQGGKHQTQSLVRDWREHKVVDQDDIGFGEDWLDDLRAFEEIGLMDFDGAALQAPLSTACLQLDSLFSSHVRGIKLVFDAVRSTAGPAGQTCER